MLHARSIAVPAVLAAGTWFLAATATAQAPPASRGLSGTRSVAGVVQRGTATGPRPIANIRVVLHRVAPDAAGPLDSLLTDSRGRYAFRYRPFGSGDAVYFVSASYQSITYFTSPLRAADVRGDDALITVFDTTSGVVPIHVVGHHVVIAQPTANGRREVVEVFELGNDSSVTLVSRGAGQPSWSAPLPGGAENPRVNPTGEIAPNNATFADGRAQFVAPLSPGVHQLSYAYDLGPGALPLSIAVEQASEVVEILLEERDAVVNGPRLAEVAPVTTAGRTFRRFLGQQVPAGSVVRVDVPFALGAVRQRWVLALAVICGAVMLGAFALALRQRQGRVRGAAPVGFDAASAAMRPSEALFREIAALDARVERLSGATDEERARFAAERQQLKERLAAALAAERSVG